MLKRAFDFVASLAGLLVLSVPMGLVAALVRLTSDGPALYGSKRCGKGGRLFTLWKFRTMERGAEAKGPGVTAAGDPRVTRLGALLRRSKIDELPQLWNVLKGDMSLVGPRPEAPEFVRPDDETWREVLSARPGITDLATLEFTAEEEVLAGAGDPELRYRNEVLPVKMDLWLKYVREHCFLGDVAIILRTLLRMACRNRNPGRTRLAAGSGRRTRGGEAA